VKSLDYRKVQAIAAQYSEIIVRVERIGFGTAYKTRIHIRDGSYIDFWFSPEGRYSYHWERRHVDGTTYRFNNAPHHKEVSTYPDHLHYGSEGNVVESRISTDPEIAVAEVLEFVSQQLREG